MSPPISVRVGEIPPRVEVSWQCLDVDDETCARLTLHLSHDEQRSAERFRFAVDDRRYRVGRGILRELLADRLGCRPRDVALTYNAFGKPYLEGTDLRFNLSHSRDLALYVFSWSAEIGCDVEWEDSRSLSRATMELVLSREELTALQSLPKNQRADAFYSYWTSKEAYLKARGVGFGLDPHEIVVSLGSEPRFIALPDDNPEEWSLALIGAAPGYAAALAVRCLG